MKKRRYSLIWIILLAVVLVVGGTLTGLLIYLDSEGLLQAIMDTVFVYGAESTIIILWVLAVPLILVVFLLFTLLRKNKVDKIALRYEEGLKTAIETERKAFAATLDYPCRFAQLTEGTDVSDGRYVESLAELCRLFRNYAAAKLGLYFFEEDVREFVASMGASKMIVLQGISGSGKTSLPYAFGQFVGNAATVIPVQPMWKERSDLLGYYNEFTRRYNETTLFRKLYEANFGNKIYVTVLDEMNIARVEYYFAEFLSLMELPDPSMRVLEIVPSAVPSDPEGIVGGKLKLPDNVWFFGTVNNDDSAYAVSDKVYDRAMVINLEGRAQPFTPDGKQIEASLSADEFSSMVKDAVDSFTFSDDVLAATAVLTDYLQSNFGVTFGNRIRRQLHDYAAVYVACGGKEAQAVDDVFAKKIFRKLEYKDAAKFISKIDGMKQLLDSMFGKDVMSQCKAFLDGVNID